MNVEQMRLAISKVYNYPNWLAKVQNMRPDQVIAIYMRWQQDGLFDKKQKAGTLRRGHKTPTDINNRQMTIFDYISEGENE